MPANRRPGSIHEVHLGANYSPDEEEFMLAMERYRREQHRPHPTCCEVLAVIKELGYRKVDGDRDQLFNG
jgi:hypothetical protein